MSDSSEMQPQTRTAKRPWDVTLAMLLLLAGAVVAMVDLYQDLAYCGVLPFPFFPIINYFPMFIFPWEGSLHQVMGQLTIVLIMAFLTIDMWRKPRWARKAVIYGMPLVCLLYACMQGYKWFMLAGPIGADVERNRADQCVPPR